MYTGMLSDPMFPACSCACRSAVVKSLRNHPAGVDGACTTTVNIFW
jgi:hypothetical protein